MTYTSKRIDASELPEVYAKHYDSIIIGISPSYYLEKDEGSCKIVMIYKKHKKYIVEEYSGLHSANRCAIKGLIKAAEQIKMPKSVVFVTASAFGFQKALKGKGKNPELWNEFLTILKKKDCNMISEVIVERGGATLLQLCTE